MPDKDRHGGYSHQHDEANSYANKQAINRERVDQHSHQGCEEDQEQALDGQDGAIDCGLLRLPQW